MTIFTPQQILSLLLKQYKNRCKERFTLIRVSGARNLAEFTASPNHKLITELHCYCEAIRDIIVEILPKKRGCDIAAIVANRRVFRQIGILSTPEPTP